MAYRGSTARVRAPLQARSRRRWLLVAGIAGLWLVFVMGSGSLLAAGRGVTGGTCCGSPCAICPRCSS